MTPHDAISGLIERGLDELNRFPGEFDADIQLTAAGALASLAHLVNHWNGTINLTAHSGPEMIARRLVLEAVAILPVLERLLSGANSLADLGSGAGFPGLPIAILRPCCRVVLVDSRRRRHFFQRAAQRALDLVNVEPVLGRIEELDPRVSDVVIAQALARPPSALEQMIPWAPDGGLLLIPGAAESRGPGYHPEVGEQGFLSYDVPLGGPTRTLWWGRRRVASMEH